MKYRIIVTFVCLCGLGNFLAATTRTLLSDSEDSSDYDYGGVSVEIEDENATYTENVQPINIAGVYYGNSTLKIGKSWKAKSGKIALRFQSDGNLVLYDQFGRSVWASETTKQGKLAEFRADGNFVVYGDGSYRLWSSQTDGYPDSKLVIQEDGNMVIYHGDDPIWSSGTDTCSKSNYKHHSKSGPVEGNLTADNELLPPFRLEKGQWWAFDSGTLLMQEDGNLVLRNKMDKIIWDSNTKGRGSRALFQENGKFVIYSDSWRPVWSSSTLTYPKAKLVPQNDGNIAIYDQLGSFVWASYTDRVIYGDNTDVDVQKSQPKQVPGNSRLNRGESWSSEAAKLTMQLDGNLVLYDAFGKPRWNSNTAGKGWRAVFQMNGNFVVFSKRWKAVWESGSAGNLNSTLAVQNDGRIVIYHGCKPVWSNPFYD